MEMTPGGHLQFIGYTPPKSYFRDQMALYTWGFSADLKKMKRALRALSVMSDTLNYTWAPNREVWVSGQESKMWVRAGLDPRYRDSPDQLIQGILSRKGLPPMVRSRLATAAMNGWVASYSGESPSILCWHRLVGGLPISITRATA